MTNTPAEREDSQARVLQLIDKLVSRGVSLDRIYVAASPKQLPWRSTWRGPPRPRRSGVFFPYKVNHELTEEPRAAVAQFLAEGLSPR